ncbi:MAG: succinate dehydrogenase/fumarate reductase iron-sulfur subunit [Opitutales bacterium]
MKLNLRIWRQKSTNANGRLVDYELDNVSPDNSFLEMLDLLNEQLIQQDEEPVVFDHDCREGICGSCSLTINGIAHGPQRMTTACQLHMRHFKDGETITIEPWRARAFPVVKDLLTDRSAFDNIIQAGGYISVSTGAAPDANAIPIDKETADWAFDGAACIGCGACVAACPNGSAMLFTSAKIAQLNSLPQGKVEKDKRTLNMVQAMDDNGFGNCTNFGECQAVCPKGIKLDMMAQMNRDYAAASFRKFFKRAG